MSLAAAFPDIVECEVPLAPHTHLRLGGPAEYLVTPRSRDELGRLLAECSRRKTPIRLLGVGTNLLVRDEGVRGAVIRLTAPCFAEIRVDGRRVRTGGGAALADVVAESCRHHLAGFETLAGIAATIGGALRCNAGDRSGEIADHVLRIEVMDAAGKIQVRERADLHFGEHSSDIDDPVVLAVEFELIPDEPSAIVKRMRRAWIHRKAALPYTNQSAVRMFKDPRGQQAATLIERAGLFKLRAGGAEVSERCGNYVVAHPGATAGDILQILALVEQRVRDSSGVQLERELNVW